MKSGKQITKSPYNQAPVKIKAQIIKQKILPKKKPQTSSQDQSSSYDSQVQDFANQFYDEAVQQADKSLQQKKDNQSKQSTGIIVGIKLKPQKILTPYQKLQSRLNQLKKNINVDEMLGKKVNLIKLKQIGEFLRKKHKQKRDFKRKLQKLLNSQKQRKKIQQQILKNKQKQQHDKRLKQIRKLSQIIKDKVQTKKDQEQQKLEKVQQFYQQFHKKFSSKKLYQLMQKKDKITKNQQYQKQQQYLRIRRKAISQLVRTQQLNQFNKIQQQRLRDLSQVKQAQKQQKYLQISQKNKQMRDKIYISYQYLQIQNQETQKQRRKKSPFQKLKKMKNYQSYVKDNFLPSIDKNDQNNENLQNYNEQNQQQQIVQINGKLYRKVKQIKYLKGQKIGQVIKNIPIAQTQQQIKRQGNSYFQMMKLIPKKRHSTSLDLSKVSEQSKSNNKSTVLIQIPKIKRQTGRINLPKNANRYEVQNLINSLKSKDQLISRKQHYLKLQSSMLPNPEKSQLDDNLIDNIERKISLLGRL